MVAALAMTGLASLAMQAQSQPHPKFLGGSQSEDDLVQVRVVCDVQQVGPGETFHLAVVFDLKKTWHIYWKNPGEGAAPPQITVRAPSGFEVGEPLWTRPRVFQTPVGREYGYEDQAVLFVPIQAANDLADGRAAFQVRIDWAVCSKVCVLGSARRGVMVQTTSQPLETDNRDVDPIVRKHKKRLPKPLDALGDTSVIFQGTTLTITGPAQGKTSAAFFPVESPGVVCGEPHVTVTDDRFQVEVKVTVSPQNAQGEPMMLGGLVALGERPDDPSYDFQLRMR